MGEFWNGDILIADLEELEKKAAGQLCTKSPCERSVDLLKRRRIHVLHDSTAKLSGRDYEFREPTPRREQNVGNEDLSGGLHGESEEPQPTEPTDDA